MGCRSDESGSIIRKPKTPPGRLRFLTSAENARLLDESKRGHRPNLYNFILVQLPTGMRPSEGAALTWNQVDFDGRIIDLRETKTDPRRVPLTVPAIETLADLAPVGGVDCDDYVFLPKKLKDAEVMNECLHFLRRWFFGRKTI